MIKPTVIKRNIKVQIDNLDDQADESFLDIVIGMGDYERDYLKEILSKLNECVKLCDKWEKERKEDPIYKRKK